MTSVPVSALSYFFLKKKKKKCSSVRLLPYLAFPRTYPDAACRGSRWFGLNTALECAVHLIEVTRNKATYFRGKFTEFLLCRMKKNVTYNAIFLFIYLLVKKESEEINTQAEPGSEQPDLDVGVSVHWKEVGLNDH